MTTQQSPVPGRVVVVGSANADLVVRVDRRPAAGETVLGGDLATVPGGKGANQAVAAARLGAAVTFVGCLGRDGHGDLLAQSLTGAGATLLVRRVTAPTGVAVILVDSGGDNSIVVSPGANAALDPADATVDAVRDAAVVVLQREVDPAVSLAAATAARGLVVLNLAPSGPMPADLLARTDVLVVNEHEAADLLGEDAAADVESAAAAGRRLTGLGPSAAVVTLGARGAVVVTAGGDAVHVRSPAVTAVDTTGAGDAFVGAIAHRLAAGDDLAAAAAVAVRVGALAVTRAGAQPSFPTAAELAAAPVDG